MRLEVLNMENNARKSQLHLNKKLLLMIGGGALVLIVLLAVLLWPSNIVSELTVEAGRDTISANEFRKEDKGVDAAFVSDLSAVDLNAVGSYPVSVEYKGKTYECTLIVEDTIAPEGKVHNVSVYSNQSVKPEDFVTNIIDASPVTVTLSPEPDLSKEAQSLITVTLTDAAGNSTSYEAVLSVFVDNGVPQITGVVPIFTFIGTEPDYLAGVCAMDDRDVALEIVVDSSKVDLNAVGTYDIIYSVTDAAGNTTTVPSTVTVTDDNTAPVIQGVHNISLYLGSAVSYRKGVVVTDDKDPSPTLEIDSSKVDLSNPGTYPLVYIARDTTGNETRLEVTVTVAEKPAAFVDEETINAKADELLKKIVTDDMTPEAKVKAIYAHMRSHYTYSGHSDKTDWMQGAWVMMDQGEGDCFNYFALTKLLLERCDIPNIDVRKVRNYEGDSDHFWSLVSVDGGNTYYHLDTTPRVGPGDDFCLVTDAFLDAYSDANKGCHNRDKSLYPATPEA
ncbi:MAG: transglutaminase domain-containing protein [Oscillospiraceae bacterium]|nr:transglutaminase domain-containing protein [Oscillospiraceae bacterium]